MTDKEFHLQCAELCKALAEGKDIQAFNDNLGEWRTIHPAADGSVSFFMSNKHRINPEPKNVYFALVYVDDGFFTTPPYRTKQKLDDALKHYSFATPEQQIIKIYEEVIENA